MVAPIGCRLVGPRSLRPARIRRLPAHRLRPRSGGCRTGRGRSCPSSSPHHSRPPHGDPGPRVRGDLGGLDESGSGPAGAACTDPQSSDVAVHRTGRTAQGRPRSGLVRHCQRTPGAASRMAGGSVLVRGLRGRRGDRVHRWMLGRGVGGLDQGPTRRCQTRSLRRTGAAVPRPNLGRRIRPSAESRTVR
jgi:hypothetical protein